MDTEGILEHISDKQLKSGEALFLQLKLGISLKMLQDLLEINAFSIERRLIEYLKESSFSPNEDFEYVLSNIFGLPYLDILRKYLNSYLTEEEFRQTYSIKLDKWKNIKRYWQDFPYIKKALKEKKQCEKMIKYNCKMILPNSPNRKVRITLRSLVGTPTL